MKKNKLVVIIFWAVAIGIVAPQTYVIAGGIITDLIGNLTENLGLKVMNNMNDKAQSMWDKWDKMVEDKVNSIKAPIEKEESIDILSEKGSNINIIKKSLIPEPSRIKIEDYVEENMDMPNIYDTQAIKNSLRNPIIDAKMYKYVKDNDMIKDEVYLENHINTRDIEDFQPSKIRLDKIQLPKSALLSIFISLLR